MRLSITDTSNSDVSNASLSATNTDATDVIKYRTDGNRVLGVTALRTPHLAKHFRGFNSLLGQQFIIQC